MASYQQSDTALTHETGCASEGAGATNATREIGDGLTQGSTVFTVDPGNNTTTACLAFRTTGGLGLSTWPSGDHTFRVEVDGSNGSSTIVAIYICERTSGGSYFTVQAFTGLSIDVSGPGVQTQVLTQSSDHTPQATDSDVAYICAIQNTDAHGNSTTDFVPSQVIDSPYDTAGSDLVEVTDEVTHLLDTEAFLRGVVQVNSEAVHLLETLARGRTLGRVTDEAVHLQENIPNVVRQLKAAVFRKITQVIG